MTHSDFELGYPPTPRGPVGIFAAGRNGSTLLMRLLDGSPDLWVHPVELNYLSFFSDLARFRTVRWKTIFNATTERPLHLDQSLPTSLLVQRFATHEDQLRNLYAPQLLEPLTLRGSVFSALEHRQRSDVREFFHALLEGAQRVCLPDEPSGQRTPIFKSIETPYLPEYQSVFPEMRFIHLVREPVANFSSIKRTMTVRHQRPFWYLGGDELETFLEKRWVPHASWILGHALQDRARHYVLTYEALCERPQLELEALCTWLGARPSPMPTTQTVLGGRTMAELPVSSSAGGKTPASVIADTAREFRYQTVVTQRERSLIGLRTGAMASALGYPVVDMSTSRWARLALAGRWLLPDRRELSYPRLTRRLDYVRTFFALVRRRGWIYSRLFSGVA